MSISFYFSGFDVLDNFSAHILTIRGVRYPTVEHAYQATKCSNPQGAEEIRNAISPIEAKRLANVVWAAYKYEDWDSIKLDVMEDLLRLKLDQHADVREALILSADELIEEDSPTDYFWGKGSTGEGENNIGKLWMKIRESL